MRRLYFLLAVLAHLPISKAQHIRQQNVSFHPYLNWKREDLRWTIAGNEAGTQPNILSEVDWSNLTGPQIGGIANIPITSKLSVEIEGSYYKITSGNVTDTDYAGDDRLYTTARFLLRADEGQVIQTKAKISYLVFQTKGLRLIPHVGYWGKYQTLYMLDGSEPLNPDRPLRSTYKPRWFGLSAGINVGYSLGQWDAELDVDGVGIVSYRAQANWNLQEQFKQPLSFAHTSSGKGVDLDFQVSHQLNSKLQLTTHFQYAYFQAGAGIDELYYANGSTVRTKLNGVYSRTIAAGFGIRFLVY